MDPDTILKEIKNYIVQEVLDGTDQGIDGGTPLLEWGIVDSIAMTGLLAFIEGRYGVDIPDEEIVPEHFETLNGLVGFVMRLMEAARAPHPKPA
jgi:acyl carrier protein